MLNSLFILAEYFKYLLFYYALFTYLKVNKAIMELVKII